MACVPVFMLALQLQPLDSAGGLERLNARTGSAQLVRMRGGAPGVVIEEEEESSSYSISELSQSKSARPTARRVSYAEFQRDRREEFERWEDQQDAKRPFVIPLRG
jgi:hypothetical protein